MRVLYSLNLIGHHHRVLFADLGRSLRLVVVGAVVLVRVAMESTEEIPTAAVEPCQADLLAAHEASVLLGFGGVGCFDLVTCVWQSGGC